MSKARVLTLEEVNNAPDDTWLYLEFREKRSYSWNAYRLACVVRVVTCEEHRQKHYGIRYRCWNQKPSAEDAPRAAMAIPWRKPVSPARESGAP